MKSKETRTRQSDLIGTSKGDTILVDYVVKIDKFDFI